MTKITLALAAIALTGCVSDDNDQAVYKNGFPANCRAYVQASVDGYRRGDFSAEDALAGLERNCGANGGIWKNNR